MRKRSTKSSAASSLKPSAAPSAQPFPKPANGSPAPHFIVGIGASAGGLEALVKLFSSMPLDNGLAFVVVQHLSPDHKSFMVELLSRKTPIPVLRAEDGLEIKPNHIYLIPPKKNLKMFQGRLLLVEPDYARGFNLPIDVFFRSLAEEKMHQSIGIVLSGTGSDGTMGIRAIKDSGGMVMVQSESTAQFDGMPRSAISTGLADFILPPEEMPRQLIQYLQHPFVIKERAILREHSSTDTLMHKVFALLKERCGADFSYYKPSTIDRRIERRITINQLNNLEEYYRYLEASSREANLLFNELLIGVTRFFRDRDAFEFLEKSVLPSLFARGDRTETIRVWIPSCSTGEEAYSMAMLFADELARRGESRSIKIFATDISKLAIEAASSGLYTESEIAEVPPDRLKRYFVRKSGAWQVSPALRQMVLFARHDLLKDPPFTKLDLVSCRNVLIYFQSALQSKVIQLLHFALKPEGILFLGNSETVGEQMDKFQALSTRHKVYQTRSVGRMPLLDLPPGVPLTQGSTVRPVFPETARLIRHHPSADLRLVDTVYADVIKDYVPACLVVDENNDVIHLLGNAGEYLRPPSGAFTRNVLKLTSHNLSVALATMLHRAQRDGEVVEFDHLRFKQGRKMQTVRVRVKPLASKEKSGHGLRLIFIEPQELVDAPKGPSEEFKADQNAIRRIADLEQELVYSKESLQATIEELETANEELQATNEELLASNEELQSTNEELQSMNEELHTLNTENQNRIEELTELSNDISNLLATSGVATLLIDSNLRIRRMSSALFALTALKPTDVGAPLEALGRELHMPELITLAQEVSAGGTPREQLVKRAGDRSFLVRLAPYRTETSAIKGLVLTLIDLTERKQQEELVQSIIDSIPAHVAVVDEMGTILYVNEPWKRFGRENDLSSGHGQVGDNYLQACQKAALSEPTAIRCMKGIESVSQGDQSHFEMQYACHSADRDRWFLVSVDQLAGARRGLVISHFNITHRMECKNRTIPGDCPPCPSISLLPHDAEP